MYAVYFFNWRPRLTKLEFDFNRLGSTILCLAVKSPRPGRCFIGLFVLSISLKMINIPYKIFIISSDLIWHILSYYILIT